MSTIKTWKQLLNERIGDMQITTNDDVRLAMQDHIDAVTEALKAAQEETHFAIQHQFVLIKQRDDFRAERDALQAKLSAIEAQEPMNELVEACGRYEAALMAAFPQGAHGEAFEQWNEARKVLAKRDAKAAQPLTKEQLRERTPDEVNEAIEIMKGVRG